MFNNDYISNHAVGPSTSYLHNLDDTNNSSIDIDQFKSKMQAFRTPATTTTTSKTEFDLSEPLKCSRSLLPNDIENEFFQNTLNVDELFKFDEPRTFENLIEESIQQSSSEDLIISPPILPIKHKVIVEQFPFSAMKSFKTQEPIEKV